MTAATRTKFDAIIVGAGLAGSTAAILLARAGWSDALMQLVRVWPGLLTRGARWGGKIRLAVSAGMPESRAGAEGRPAVGNAM